MDTLRHELEQIVSGDRVLDNELWREIYGRDASYFKIIPEAVVRPQTTEEVRRIMALATRRGLSVTFRTGGAWPSRATAGTAMRYATAERRYGSSQGSPQRR